MDLQNIRFEKEGAVATITIDRPKALNALNYDTLQELLYCFRQLARDRETGVVIITGGGEKSFVAGADISHMVNLEGLEGTEFARLGHEAMAAVESAPQPVIAAVNGFALGGGCELAISCDIRVASENAKFGQPEVNLGVIPGFGGTQRLPRLVGKGLACELLFTGDMIDAAEALRIGLVNKVVPQAELMDVCREMAKKITSKGPVAIRLCKETVNNGSQMDLGRANHYEAIQFGQCFASADQKEGMQAFLEKRKAEFTGK
ncbi:enoyl-CoA hydratase-related protein [Desulfopila sp. IMCC35008]|uniref:enoyl-CoA hydratase-related protein n=1 Tax=Desulfopila sp. IMCC35008 TaxID=2653858 RepID=UPI0013D6FA92|nr:enoyl-CoA hydratase-related protein [Desulfopila sp. IMCC35008]